jgi:hypothetical protein
MNNTKGFLNRGLAIGVRHPSYKKIDEEELNKLYNDGLSQTQLGKHFGVSQFVISRRLFPEKYRAYDKKRYADRKRKNKKLLVEYKGGSCEMCGYNKCLDALDFHHVDPKEKLFTISQRRSYNIDVLKKEADKCILVCSNCHAELHVAEYNAFTDNL